MKNLIHPCLWYDGNAKEAAEFYCSVFDNSRITSENHMVVNFESSGQTFMCLNGGSQFKLNPSISFYVICETEEEVDLIWKKLLNGGSVLMPLDKYPWSKKYGWVQDKFGVSWQLSFNKLEDVGQKFTPVLMFTGNQNGKAEQAVNFYTSVFKNSEIVGILKYSEEENEVVGNVKHAHFRLGKQAFMAMDSSKPHSFGFNEAISLFVNCKTQDEIDYYWNKFTDEGEESQCGWLKDKFGISWQIVPVILEDLMSDPSKSGQVVNAFLKMKKFEIDKLIQAAMV